MSESPVAAVMMHVPDWKSGLEWYQKAFPEAQVRSIDEWSYLEYQGVPIEIVQADEKVGSGAAGSVVYWTASDFDERLEYLLSIGATLFRGPMNSAQGTRICQVRDPFGNPIGIKEAGGT